MNIVGEGFHKNINDQVKQRQKIYGSGYDQNFRTPEQLTYLNANSSWCRLVSGTNVANINVLNNPAVKYIGLTGNELARRFVLFNGSSHYPLNSPIFRSGVNMDNNFLGTNSTLSQQNTIVATKLNQSAYGIGGNEFGLNPMPGIQSVSVTHENRGSLRQAAIKIKAFNKVQLEILDVLYLRLGYSVLLEWGHSMYYDNNGILKTNENNSLVDDFLSGNYTYDAFLSKIKEMQLQTFGNYDAMFAKVKNFHWSFNKDGSYDIDLDLISSGDVIESLKANAIIEDPLSTEAITKDETDQPDPEDEGEVIDFHSKSSSIGQFMYFIKYQLDSGDYSKEGTSNYPDSDSTDDNKIFSFYDMASGESSNNSAASSANNNINSSANQAVNATATATVNALESAKVNNPQNILTSWWNAGIEYIQEGVEAVADVANAVVDVGETVVQTVENVGTAISNYFYPPPINLDPSLFAIYDCQGNQLRVVDGYCIPWDDKDGNDEIYYVRFGTFLAYLQNYVIPKCKAKNLPDNLTPILKIDYDQGTNLMYAHRWQVGIDPRICIVSRQVTLLEGIIWETWQKFGFAPEGTPFINSDFTIDDITINGTRVKSVADTSSGGQLSIVDDTSDIGTETQNEIAEYGNIMNIYINCTFVLNKLDELRDDKGNVSIFDLLKAICDGINEGLGGLNALEPVINEETNTVKFIDANPLPNKDQVIAKLNSKCNYNISTESTPFELYGYVYDGVEPSNSFIKDFDFKTEITPEYATMITVGAAANGAVVGANSTALSKLNIGLEDRFKTEVLDTFNAKNSAVTASNELEALKIRYEKTIIDYFDFLQDMSPDGSWDEEPKLHAEDINAYKTTLKNIVDVEEQIRNKIYAKKLLDEGINPSDPTLSPGTGFIPFNLSVTIDGMSGMKIYQKFNVDTKFLPSNYPTFSEFLIKGITHEIQNNKWSTKLESFMVSKGKFAAEVIQASERQSTSEGSSDAPSTPANIQTNNNINKPVKGGKTWTSLSDSQKKNAIYLYNTLISYGFTDIESRAILGIVSKESGFAPRNEVSYKNTSAKRIKQVFPSKFKSKTDAEVDRIKQDDKTFWNTVYGNKYGNGPDDGWRYLGRGFNGLTFKGIYQEYQKLYTNAGSKAGNVNIVTNPDSLNAIDNGIYKIASHFCALYFQDGKRKHFKNATTNNLDTAIWNFMRANAGWGSSTNGAIFQEGLAKAKKFVASLPDKIS
jgi:predicted chitinase